MRCIGEIDITRPRWSERPSALVPVILGNIRNFEPGEHERRFEAGRQEAADKEQELLARLRALPDGEQKAARDQARRSTCVRTFIGYREYPKYGIVSRYFVYKQALMAEAERLVQAGVLRAADDIFYLTFPELHDVVRTGEVDDRLIEQRRDAYRVVLGAHAAPRADLGRRGRRRRVPARRPAARARWSACPCPPGPSRGGPASSSTWSRPSIEAGDILVTAYTDPSWSPLFVAIRGLVTEVGGLMTHGAVIAREYGLPAVVGVVDATRLIEDGQRIRVNGTDGYVEILTDP